MAKEDSIPTVDAHDLSWWAETAEGLLNEDLYVVRERGRLVILKESDYKGEPCIIRFRTGSKYVQRQPPHVFISGGGPGPNAELTGCDAVFWSESSVEKMLWPYYRSQRIYDRDVAAVRNAFRSDASIVAVLHTFPSHPNFVRDLGIARRDDAGNVELLGLDDYRRLKGVW